MTSAIIPAHNEARTIKEIVENVKNDVDEVIVVDSCSSDSTATEAVAGGAKVVKSDIIGKHNAIKTGIFASAGERIVFLDGDWQNLPLGSGRLLLEGLNKNPNIKISKAYYDSENTKDLQGGGRLTELCARPLIALLLPELSFVRQPLSGEYAVFRKDIINFKFAVGFSVDLGILINCSKIGEIEQINLGRKVHKHKSLIDLGKASVEIASTILCECGYDFIKAPLIQFNGEDEIFNQIDLKPLSPIKNLFKQD